MRTIGLQIVDPVEPGPQAPKAVADMKKAELIAYAKEHGIEIDAKATVAVIREAIEPSADPDEESEESEEDEEDEE